MASSSGKVLPGTVSPAEVFIYPFFADGESKEFIENHGRIMFIIRGPPGTGKGDLNDLMALHFPRGVKCSADDFRTEFPQPAKECHHLCQKMVQEECRKRTNPVIVSNTHMIKRDMQEYLKIAEKNEYAVLVISTMDKFAVSPEILAKTNTKGLGKEYFEKRLKAWTDVYPVAMGWFLRPADVSAVFHRLQTALDVLLGEERFRTAFSTADSATTFDNYNAKTLLWCMAGCMRAQSFELKSYYKSPEVRNSYGKCFTFAIHTFLVMKSHIFAAVHLDPESKNLVFKRNFAKNIEEDDEDNESVLVNLFSVSLADLYPFRLVPLRSQFSENSQSNISDTISNSDEKCFNVSAISFIHLAQNARKRFSPHELNQIFRKTFTGLTAEDGKISAEKIKEVEGGYAICEAKKDAWLIRIPNVLSLKTVFTGLYI